MSCGKPERTRLFRFNKPPGLITAERDPAGRPTIYTLAPFAFIIVMTLSLISTLIERRVAVAR